jgi:glycerol uptake facilitator-like aquaporin
MKKFAAETLGTFALVFGTGAIVINEVVWLKSPRRCRSHVGLIVLAMIYTFGDVSGT